MGPSPPSSRHPKRANPVGQKNLLRGFSKSSMWTDLSRQSVSGICSDWHLHARTYRTGGHNCRVGLRTRDLFLFPSAFGNRLHLHLWVNGAAKIRAPDATGDDSRDRTRVSKVPHVRRDLLLLVVASRI